MNQNYRGKLIQQRKRILPFLVIKDKTRQHLIKYHCPHLCLTVKRMSRTSNHHSKLYSYQFLCGRCLIPNRVNSHCKVCGHKNAVIYCYLPADNGFKFSRLNPAPNTRHLRKNVPAHNRAAMQGFVRAKRIVASTLSCQHCNVFIYYVFCTRIDNKILLTELMVDTFRDVYQ